MLTGWEAAFHSCSMLFLDASHAQLAIPNSSRKEETSFSFRNEIRNVFVKKKKNLSSSGDGPDVQKKRNKGLLKVVVNRKKRHGKNCMKQLIDIFKGAEGERRTEHTEREDGIKSRCKRTWFFPMGQNSQI